MEAANQKLESEYAIKTTNAAKGKNKIKFILSVFVVISRLPICIYIKFKECKFLLWIIVVNDI